jgi:hypothetical protein
VIERAGAFALGPREEILMKTVRDALWIWGHEAGSHTTGRAREQWGLPGDSRITPVDAARYLGVPNCAMVAYGNRPAPPFTAEAAQMSPLQRVVWSIVGDASTTRNDEQTDLDAVLALAEQFPNITGAIMDDFFGRGPDGLSRHSTEALKTCHRRLHEAPRELDLWVVLYHRQLDLPIADHLDFCDVVTFWNMAAKEMPLLEDNFARLVALTPNKRRVLGCYLWDYAAKEPMPLDAMRHQCDLGLQWLREGQIEGIIFLGSCICDLGLEAVEWTRDWIAEVGDEPLPIA